MTALQTLVDDSIKHLTFVRELIKLRRVITLQPGRGEEWASDEIRCMCPVDVDFEPAALGNPPIYDVTFSGDDEVSLVLDTSRTDWEPEEGTEYTVRLIVQGKEDEEVEGKWTAKRFCAANAASLWLVVVEIQEGK
jgi:hypothetical protein